LSFVVENLSFSYEPKRPVLKNVSFTAQSGQLLAVLGPNGVGKTTLFRCMLGLSRNYQGHCLIDGEDVHDFSAATLARRIAYIPQSHYPAFNFNVFDMVLMGTTAKMGIFSSPGPAQHRQAEEAIEHMGLARLRNRGYGQISGGERQLALVARALAQNARILIMDEPTANLDYGNRLRVLVKIRALTREGYTIIQSTHSPEDAFRYSDAVLALEDGQVIAYGVPDQVLDAVLVERLYGVKVKILRPNKGAAICIPVEPFN
jgi:iron complex transport system ATP-binding protein